MSHTVTLTQKSQNSQVLFFSGLISQCFRPERFNSQAKTSRTNSRTNKPMCKVHDKYRLSYELLSPTTSLSWRMLGWTSSPQHGLCSRGLQLVERKLSLTLSPKEQKFQQAKQHPKERNWVPQKLVWVSLSLHLPSTESPVLSFTLRSGFRLDYHQQWHVPLKSTCEKLGFSSHKKYSVKKFLPTFVLNHLKNIVESCCYPMNVD